MLTTDNNSLLDSVETLLENQIECARKGDFDAVQTMTRDSALMMNRLVSISHLDDRALDARRQRIRGLHRQLVLMLAAEKESVGRQLKLVANGKRAVGAYKGGERTVGWSEKGR